MSARGSERLNARFPRPGIGKPARERGFTLIELMVVVTLVAVASAVAVLALRDPAGTQLEREAARLSAILEAARVEARAAGIAVLWVPGGEGQGFRFVGLPATMVLPNQWLDPAVQAQVRSSQGVVRAAVLGPEPVIGPQRIELQLASQRLAIETDGMGPFTRADDAAGP